jgi:N-acylneuraminate cytidylyltransferase
MNIAIIPARGGSKRIKQKNIRPFCGRPIIEYSLQVAQDSGLFGEIVVSTDCPVISALAQTCGARVIQRPAELSDDLTPLMPVIKHAISWLEAHPNSMAAGENLDSLIQSVCCILATAPFVTEDDLNKSLEQLTARENADFVVPVTTFPFPIQRGLKIENDNLTFFWPEHEMTRSQDLPESYHDAGQFYWGTRRAWVSRDRIFSSLAIAYQMPRHRVQDLDTLEDWARAEQMFLIQQPQSDGAR